MLRNRFGSGCRIPLVTLGVVAAALLTPVRLVAQEIGATVTGTVTDPQAAVLPGVTVTVLNVDTNVPAESVTNSEGVYAVQKLIPGRYKVTAALQGFKTYVRDGITLHTAEVGSIHITLELGEVQENLTVTAELTQVETNQSTLAQTMENRQVAELPLNGRQVYMLLQLTSGTLFTQTQFGASGFSGTRAWDVNGSVTIHGSRTGNNEFLIDGATNAGTGGWTYAPPVDAIEEFKVQTSSTDASYGRTSGGVVNLRLRAGTNELRGAGTLLFRGTALDSNQIQNITNHISNKGHAYVDGEGMLSGPMVHSRTFFMGGYQGFRENIPFPITRTVPTDAQLAGDFRGTLNGSGQQITIYDPATTRQDPTRPLGSLIRDPISCNGVVNVICPDRVDSVARALIAFMPHANAQGDITGANNLIASPNTGFYRYNSYLTRIDHNFSDRHKIAFSNSGNWGTERRNENALPPPALRSDNWPTHRNHYLATAEDNLTLSSTTLISTRVSFDRFAEPHAKEFGLLKGATLPFKTPFQVTQDSWFPHLTLSGSNSFYQEEFGRPPRESVNNIYQAQSTISRTVGRHLVKAGGDFRLYQLIRNDFNEANGLYEFRNGPTQKDPRQADSTSGNAVASFLLGFAENSSKVSINAASDRRYPYYDLFVQDDWKLSGRATLGLGLRWDHQAPVYEKNNQLVTGFDMTTSNPLRVPGLNLVGGLLFANHGGPRSPYKSEWKDFQPRASVSYKLNERVIARSNYGRSFLPLTGCCDRAVIQTSFSQDTNMVATVQTGLPFNMLSAPFPNGFLQPTAGSQGLLTGVGTSLDIANPNFKVPYADQWMAGVSVEMPGNIGLDLAYVGNYVSKLPTAGGDNGTRINEIPLAERQKGIERLGGNPQYLDGLVPNPFAGLVDPALALNNSMIARRQLLRPFPQFNTIIEKVDNKGWSKYHAFELVARKRFSHGLQAALNYTLSRLREAVDYQNAGYESTPIEELASIDRPHHVTMTALYELPFGPGKAIGGNSRGATAAVISGWQFNVLHEYASGTPTAAPGAILKPGCNPALPAGQQTHDRWFDISCFLTIPANDFRTTGFRMRGVRNPSIQNTAFSLFKSNRVGHVNVQFRAELFNPFNVRLYGGPNTTLNGPQFGRISPSQENFSRTGQIGVHITF